MKYRKFVTARLSCRFLQIAAIVFATVTSVRGLSAAVESRPVDGSRIDQVGEQVMQGNEFRSVRRMVQDKLPESDIDKGFLQGALDWLGQQIRNVFDAIGDFFRWLFSGFKSPGTSAPPAAPPATSSGSADWDFGLGNVSQIFTIAMVAMIGVVLIVIVAMIVKSIDGKKRRRDGLLSESEDVLSDVTTPPGELAASTYESRALQFAAAGNYRAAIRELLLGSMSWIERAGLIRYRRGLTNRDYVRSVWRRIDKREGYLTTASQFEFVYFGRRKPTAEMFETCLASFQGAFREEEGRRLLQSDTFWGLTAALLVLLQFWWLPGEDGSAADSYSTTVDGKLGIYRTLSQLFPRVERDALLVVPNEPECLVLIAPDRYPNDQEQAELYEFVYRGGTLVFAPNWDDPDIEMRSLGIQTTARPFSYATATTLVAATPASPNPATPATETTIPAEAEEADATDKKGPLSPEEIPKTPGLTPAPGIKPSADEINDSSIHGEKLEVTSQLSDGAVDWNTSATLEVPSYLATETLVTSASGNIEAATWTMGSGRVVACSSPDIFSNRSLLHRDSLRLAVRLVERGYLHTKEAFGERTRIVLSEFFNASDAYQQTGVLFSPSLRIGTLQLLLVAVLGIWLAFYRFGPAEEVSTLQRRSLTESAQAVGNLQYRLNDGGPVIRSYLEYIRSQLRRRYGSLVRLDQPESLANRAGMDPDEVRNRLALAWTLADQAGLSSGQTASTLRWLAELQHRLAGTKNEETT